MLTRMIMLTMSFVSPLAIAQLTPEAIRVLGYEARLTPDSRAANVQLLAAEIQRLAMEDRERLQELQEDFQAALLLVCDPGVIDTLSDESEHAVDDALDAAYSVDELLQGGDWDALAYVHGFFNRDVTAEQIRELGERWNAMPEDEREPQYPTFIHAIDEVTKPLSVSELESETETLKALESALPLLKTMLMQPPKEGRAFHPPSHACLVLGPLYVRWAESPKYGPLVTRELGDRAAFIELMSSRLVGDRAELEPWEYRFYGVVGYFMANTLARMDARDAVPVLKASLVTYEAHENAGQAIDPTRRALAALGDADERARLEAMLNVPADREDAIETAVWLCRNGRGETKTYGQALLAKAFDCPPEAALDSYFRQQLSNLASSN